VPGPGAGVAPVEENADERTVRYDFRGNWAIFQLLLARTIVRDADAPLLRDLPPTVLAFDIPVQPDPAKPPLARMGAAAAFELYMRLGVLARGKTELLTVGALPTDAPPTVSCLGM
jgi:hypothetical protein